MFGSGHFAGTFGSRLFVAKATRSSGASTTFALDLTRRQDRPFPCSRKCSNPDTFLGAKKNPLLRVLLRYHSGRRENIFPMYSRMFASCSSVSIPDLNFSVSPLSSFVMLPA